MEEPQLPRQRKIPRRFETGDGEPYVPLTVEEYYREQYLIMLITSRFDQPGVATYRSMESLLIKAAEDKNYDEEFRLVTSLYEL